MKSRVNPENLILKNMKKFIAKKQQLIRYFKKLRIGIMNIKIFSSLLRSLAIFYEIQKDEFCCAN